MPSTEYGEFDRQLGEAGSGLEAAEAHGCLCGALCAEQAFPAAEWAGEILPDDADAELVAPLVEVLAGIREETLDTLAGDDLDFQPLLPQDSQPLEERVRALAAWCGGFLYGLGRSGSLDPLSGDLEEILRDFSELSRAALSGDEADEDAERDFTELVEFVRAGVLLAYAELAPLRARSVPAGRRQH